MRRGRTQGRRDIRKEERKDVRKGRKSVGAAKKTNANTHFEGLFCWSQGSTGVQMYGCIPRSAANSLGEIPKTLGAPNLLF